MGGSTYCEDRVARCEIVAIGAQRSLRHCVAERSSGIDNPLLYFTLLRSSELEASSAPIPARQHVVSTADSELPRSITLPPLAEQKAIAAVLGALDDKIELNRRMNATLEAMARALFQSWFVDFDPVRAKLDGRPPAALDPATAALFPDSLRRLRRRSHSERVDSRNGRSASARSVTVAFQSRRQGTRTDPRPLKAARVPDSPDSSGTSADCKCRPSSPSRGSLGLLSGEGTTSQHPSATEPPRIATSISSTNSWSIAVLNTGVSGNPILPSSRGAALRRASTTASPAHREPTLIISKLRHIRRWYGPPDSPLIALTASRADLTASPQPPTIPHPRHPARHAAAEAAERGVERGRSGQPE